MGGRDDPRIRSRTFVGRVDALEQIDDLRATAGSGSLAVVVVVGDAGIGKTALAEAASQAASTDGWTVVWVQGVDSDAALAYAGLLSLVSDLRTWLPAVPEAQRVALTGALGWTAAAGPDGDRFQVFAATLALFAAAAEDKPLLVIVDDVPWLDRESTEAILFAARRTRRDRLAYLLTKRLGTYAPVSLDGCIEHHLEGLPAADAVRLLGSGYAATVANRLTAQTGGNPLALLECDRLLSPVQKSGASDLPQVLPVPERLTRIYSDELALLSADASFAVRLAAASHDPTAGPIVAALGAAGLDAQVCLDEASEVLRHVEGEVRFRHPLLRFVAWERATAPERRKAHAALANELTTGAARTWHRVEAAVGYDRTLSSELAAVADLDRSRRGYAAASTATERAARLTPDEPEAARLLASAAEDAYLAGDGTRARRLAAEVLARTNEPAPRASVLLTLGLLEQHTGTFGRARELFLRVTEIAESRSLIRGLVELAHLCYVFDDRAGMTAAAERAQRVADPADPEQSMLASYLSGAAQVVAGQVEDGAVEVSRALELLESEASLRDDPRHLTVTLLCARWLMVGDFEFNGVSIVEIGMRRIAAARDQGALGPLAVGLSLASSGLAWLGDHLQAYAMAGEAVDLLDALGYRVEPGVAHETLALECAARGRHTESAAMLSRAEEVMRRTGFSERQPHLAHAMIDCALSRGDFEQVVTVAEDQIRRNGGAGGLLEPLGVAPWLVEAYLGLGRDQDARDLARRHLELNRDFPHPYVAGMVARCQGLVADDLADGAAEFERAIACQIEVGDQAESGRTRLLYGMRLRRAGQRVAARAQLREAIADFTAIDHLAWVERAAAELRATGERARSRSRPATSALTSQETRVALLVAQGMTNREVATSLFLSPKTVEHHLGSVLRKRGLRSRTELAVEVAAVSGE
jgi:DNA-binding CsgD family transcriptional regulator